MSLQFEPSSEPLHISSKKMFSNRAVPQIGEEINAENREVAGERANAAGVVSPEIARNRTMCGVKSPIVKSL